VAYFPFYMFLLSCIIVFNYTKQLYTSLQVGIHFTSKNIVIYNHSLCDYVQLNVTYDYEWSLMQLFFKFGWIWSSFQLIATMTYFIF